MSKRKSIYKVNVLVIDNEDDYIHGPVHCLCKTKHEVEIFVCGLQEKYKPCNISISLSSSCPHEISISVYRTEE